MDDNLKIKQLRSHKQLATGLFILMLAIYIALTWLSNTSYVQPWMGYVKAFAEAAMVGALADWFAVTALFHHPLGLPIPHTNLIESKKKSIGDNLGNFVVSNFLTAGNIRPYINKLAVAGFAADWLSKKKNKTILITEVSRMLNDILSKTDDRLIIRFIAKKGSSLLDDVKINKILSGGLLYFLNRDQHERIITALAEKICYFIHDNEGLVRDKVKQESSFFIPKFIDNKLAQKISGGLISYFAEIAVDADHPLREEITKQLYLFAKSLEEDSKWEQSLNELKKGILSPEKMNDYAADIWHNLKTTLLQELRNENSMLLRYFSRNIDDLAESLKTDVSLQQKIDGWVRHTAYKYILRNSNRVGSLISDTVGNWQGRELSRKLELEVGKDLQFIRINGTLVGGLVGLLIYTITIIFSK